MLSLALIVLLSYLAGSIPASVWIGKAFYGKDIREYGSGNAGATNAFRVFGWKAGVLATIVDVGKGLLAAGVIAGLRVGPLPEASAVDMATLAQILAGMAAVVGHLYPVFAGFQGGKGMNTSAGVLLAITPVTTLLTIAVFAVVLVAGRYVSLASITAAVAFPTILIVRKYVFGVEALDISLVIFGVVLGAVVILAHQSNIRRLLSGTENRVGSFRPARGMVGKKEA